MNQIQRSAKVVWINYNMLKTIQIKLECIRLSVWSNDFSWITNCKCQDE